MSATKDVEAVWEYVEHLEPELLGLAEPPKVELVSPLQLGESNLNFLVKASGNKYVFRLNMDTSAKGKSRREFETLRMLSGHGVSPRAFHLDESRKAFDETLLILEYVEGQPLSERGIAEFPEDLPAKLARLIAGIHSLDLGDRLHGLPTRGSSYEGWVRTNQKNIDYIRRRRPFRARDNKLLDRLLDDGLSRIKIIAQEALYTNVTTPAHGDVCAQNVIFDGSNTSLHLVDWENFGLWDPAAEIALIFEGFGLEFQPNQEDEFLDCYCGLREDNTLLERLDAFRPLVRFEQLTWGVKHVLEIAGGDMDKAFVERTDMDKHMTFVDSCIKKCSETYLIDVSPERARELTILPPTPSQL